MSLSKSTIRCTPMPWFSLCLIPMSAYLPSIPPQNAPQTSRPSTHSVLFPAVLSTSQAYSYSAALKAPLYSVSHTRLLHLCSIADLGSLEVKDQQILLSSSDRRTALQIDLLFASLEHLRLQLHSRQRSIRQASSRTLCYPVSAFPHQQSARKRGWILRYVSYSLVSTLP